MQYRVSSFFAGFITVCSLVFINVPVRSQVTPPPSNVWQYSVSLEPGTERRAYLWIPPACMHVRGVLLGLQNMLERPMFEDPTIRAAIAESDMAIVWISPGAWPLKTSTPIQPSLDFTPKDAAIAGVQRTLTALAQESGYTELASAPLLVTGHSAAAPFVWGMASALPGRVFAALPYKNSITQDDNPIGVPTLYVSQEWAEWGNQWGEVWHKEMAAGEALRKRTPNAPFGEFVDVGSGHFDWHHDSAGVLALFIHKAAALRLPRQIREDQLDQKARPIKLTPIPLESGVLVDPDTLGTPQFKAIPYRQWKGDPATGFWYFDREMADTINQSMLEGLQKKPQAIDFVADGRPVSLVANGFAALKPEFLPDGITFRVHAQSLDRSPSPNLYGGKALGHAASSITYRVSSGALRQVGPDTFQVAARAGGLLRQGMPWEPWIMATQPGDANFRSTDKPAHILINIRNATGDPQTIHFDPIGDVHLVHAGDPIHLHATASSGLPVQFYVESGPAVIAGDTLQLLAIPPRSRYPVHVIVSAFQWGRTGPRPIQTVGPQTQEFNILP